MIPFLLALVVGCPSFVVSTDMPDEDTEPSDTNIIDTPQDTEIIETGGMDTVDTLDSESADTDDSEGQDTGDVPEPAPAIYLSGRTHSPINPWVKDIVHNLSVLGEGLSPNVFMKVGASSTVAPETLYCFVGDAVDLGTHTSLEDTLAFYLSGDASGDTPFDRDTQAAQSGRSTGWAITGNPSPVEKEITAISPQIAIIHYGTNDMQQGATYETALDLYFQNMSELLDQLSSEGIVPILTGISRRADSAAADRWVDTWNAAIRGMAQDRQIPFIDLEWATKDLEDYGLANDGLHMEAYSGGACVLSSEGLQHGYNVRNLIVLEALDRLHRVLDLDEPAPDTAPTLQGEGVSLNPWMVPEVPFAHVADTSLSNQSQLDSYPMCNADQDESGPERVYRFTLTETTKIRLTVSDQEDADIDIHLLDASGTADGCIARGNRTISGELAEGSYVVVLDSWVDGDEPLSGEYLFTITTCQSGDSSCNTSL